MSKALSITAFVFSLLFFVPLAPFIGLSLGIVAVIKAKNDPNALKGLAIAAIIISSILVLLTLFFGAVLVRWASQASFDSAYEDSQAVFDEIDLESEATSENTITIPSHLVVNQGLDKQLFIEVYNTYPNVMENVFLTISQCTDESVVSLTDLRSMPVDIESSSAGKLTTIINSNANVGTYQCEITAMDFLDRTISKQFTLEIVE